MKRCCIIGGTGFIGSHLVGLLHGMSRDITVVGRSPVPSRRLPDGVSYLAGDYGEERFLREILKDVDELVLLAHTTVPKTSFEDPVHDILSNLPAAVTLFVTASAMDIRKLVYVSSGGTVYGKVDFLPIDETHPTHPISPYGITKLTIEKYANMYHCLSALPVVCVRPGNAFGEGQKPFIGQGFVATAIGSILSRKEVVIFGENGTIRDYIYVGDVAGGIMAALDAGVPGTCYNIGSGVGRSNREVLEELRPYATEAGFDMRIKVMPERHFDVPANILDGERISRETGWLPRVPFSDGIRLTWNWQLREAAGVSGE